MSICDIFIRRPVMTSLIWLGVMIFGIMAYRQLPVTDLPSVDFPTVQVTANLPGASPDTMASAVATPLEREFSIIAGLDSMNSQSATGVSNITLQFSLDRNIDAASQDVQAAITRASAKLPPNMPTPPFFRKVNPADMPILYLALSSPLLPLSAINEYADTFMSQRISMISGVAQVLLVRRPEIRRARAIGPQGPGQPRPGPGRGGRRRGQGQRQPAHRHPAGA